MSSVSAGAPRRPAVADAAAFRSVTGWRPVPAVLFAVALTAVGVLTDRLGVSALGWGTRVGFTVGVVVAVVMVRRRSLYTAAVQPPMVFIGVVLTVFGLTKARRLTVTVIGLTTAFPAMAAATALVAVVALIQKLRQPLLPARRPPKQPSPDQVGARRWARPVHWSGMFNPPNHPPRVGERKPALPSQPVSASLLVGTFGDLRLHSGEFLGHL